MAWDPNAILEFKVVYLVNGQTCMNVLHYHPGGNSIGFTVPELCDAFLQANGGTAAGTLGKAFQDILSNDAVIIKTTAQGVYPVRYAVRERVVNASGLQGNPCDAQNVQLSFIKRGDLGNRHNVGGLRLGGVPTNFYQAGLVTAAGQLAMGALVGQLSAQLGDGVSAASYAPVIANKTKVIVGGKDKFVLNGYTLIESLEQQPYIRTQRTRTFQRGI